MSKSPKDVLGGLEISPVSKENLQQYVDLFAVTFPKTSFTLEYLEWMYLQNPQGNFIGFDAISNGKVVAHYACIPIEIEGFSQKCLLSLNTATHPDFQGQGLFKELAQHTYDTHRELFSCVIGVANGNSEKTFLKKLGFVKLGNLELRFGILNRGLDGSRLYSRNEAFWRSQCPGRKLHLREFAGSRLLFTTKRIRGVFRLKSLVHLGQEQKENLEKTRHIIGFTLDWRRDSKPLLYLPKRFKPSPLNLIYKPMSEDSPEKLTSFSYPDFDAF